jgi:hypothetical protein
MPARSHMSIRRLCCGRRRQSGYSVMRGLDPRIHAYPRVTPYVDGRDKPGHDEEERAEAK